MRFDYYSTYRNIRISASDLVQWTHTYTHACLVLAVNSSFTAHQANVLYVVNAAATNMRCLFEEESEHMRLRFSFALTTNAFDSNVGLSFCASVCLKTDQL